MGDIHGCLPQLEQVLLRLNQYRPDRYVFLGDLMHKGPDSVGAVRLVHELSLQRDVVLIRGNHEAKELTRRELPLSSDEWEFLKRSEHWYQGAGYLCVHGGIPTDMAELPPDPRVVPRLSNSRRKLFDRMMYMRRVSATDGSFVSLNTSTAADPYWAERYDGRFGHVFFGHEAWVGATPRRFPHATGLDLGCVYGGCLAAYVLEDGAPPTSGVLVLSDPGRAWAALQDID